MIVLTSFMRRRMKKGGVLSWSVNHNALLAIIPNVVDAEIVLYSIDNQVFIIRFVDPDVRGVCVQFCKKEDNGSVNVLDKKRIAFEEARRLWCEFDQVSSLLPEVLQPVGSPRRLRRVARIFVVLGVALVMGVFGWWWGQTGVNPIVGMGSNFVSSVVVSDSRRDEGNASPPMGVSSVLRQQDDRVMAGAAPSQRVEELPYSASQLLALHELRLALQEGRDIPEPLFRQLPEDVRRLLVAEGIVPASVGEREERPTPVRESELRREVGGEERDVYGIPAIPPRLPDIRALPPLGGGDLRSVGDFQAFGLQR